MKEIGNNIRALRLKHQKTQAELANAIGVQYQTVSKWETATTTPDIAMLPRIADFFHITIDELFGRKQVGCSGSVPENQTEFLLNTYAQMFAPEAGPWNLSVENKYLEYRFADFFEKHFCVEEETNICNIGIGAGAWDLYLSYRLKKGSLTSIDQLEICCKQLEQRLLCEGNPNDVRVICSNAMALEFDKVFDIVTMVGTTAIESGNGLELLNKAIGFVKDGGAIYYQSLDENEDCNAVLQTAYQNNMKLAAFLEDDAYGFLCRYYKLERA